MEPVWSLLLGLVGGFVLAQLPRAIDRRRNLLSYWRALRAEIEYCHDGALDIEKPAQLGRLPTTIYDEVLKHIVTEADIDAAEVRTLMRYYDLVRQTDVALDRFAAAVDGGPQMQAVANAERNRLKVKTAKFAADAEDSYYAPTIALANRRCSRSILRF